MSAARAFVRKQTLISICITIAISTGFFLLVFRLGAPVHVWQPDYLALDFLPQSVIAAFMAGLMPALQTRKAIVRGDIASTAPAVRAIVLRALLCALLGLGLAGLVIGLLKVSGVAVFPWGTAFAIKLAYGGMLGLLVTTLALRAILNKG